MKGKNTCRFFVDERKVVWVEYINKTLTIAFDNGAQKELYFKNEETGSECFDILKDSLEERR